MSTSAVLLLSGPDARGLVAAVSEFIYRAGGNVIHADQHSDPEEKMFLQRVEWDLEGFSIPRERILEAFGPIADRFGMRAELHVSDHVPRVAILVSKYAHCLHDLIARRDEGELRFDLPLVVSNHEDLRPIGERAGARYEVIPVATGDEDAACAKLLALLERERIELVVLARYMRILRGPLLERFAGRIINIHHSFLPAFAGARPYHQAYTRGVKLIGATAHYVTADLDQGPIIEQDVERVSHRDDVDDLVRKGRDLEKVVLARAVGHHIRRRVLVYGNKTVVFD